METFKQQEQYNLKEYKKYLSILLNEEKKQKQLIEKYKKLPKSDVKRRKQGKLKVIKKSKERPRYWFDMETAMAIVRSEGIESSIQYKLWHKANNPMRMPKYPDRMYESTWKGWNYFLGTNNTFGYPNKGRSYRSFEDAQKFAKSLNLKNREEWLLYVKSGKLPDDVPRRPDYVYSRGKRDEYWLSWKDFLGYGTQIKTIEEQHNEVTPIVYICKKRTGLPNNIYVINIIPGGISALKDHIIKMDMILVSAFYTTIDYNAKSEIKKYSTYKEYNDCYIIGNIYELINEFENNMEKVRF